MPKNKKRSKLQDSDSLSKLNTQSKSSLASKSEQNVKVLKDVNPGKNYTFIFSFMNIK